MSLIRTRHGTETPNFLASAVGVIAKTMLGYDELGVSEGETKVIPAGTVYPSNDANAIGIVYSACDITAGEKPCSVMVAGRVYEDCLAQTLTSEAKNALKTAGIVFDTAPTMERPYK